jgi:hypothetical protein
VPLGTVHAPESILLKKPGEKSLSEVLRLVRRVSLAPDVRVDGVPIDLAQGCEGRRARGAIARCQDDAPTGGVKGPSKLRHHPILDRNKEARRVVPRGRLPCARVRARFYAFVPAASARFGGGRIPVAPVTTGPATMVNVVLLGHGRRRARPPASLGAGRHRSLLPTA